MDRGRKAMPVQNKACMERYVRKCQKMHQQKIRDMKCSVDNKSPFQPTHLKAKAKKNALMEERFTQIETENRLLLEKMSHIMRFKGGIDNNNDTAQYAHSLNRDRRRRELQRITKQNLQILTRIEESRPTYDHSTWEEEARVKDRIMDAHSLNRDRRRRELQQITKQSLQILMRIEESYTTNDYLTREEEVCMKDRDLAKICEF